MIYCLDGPPGSGKSANLAKMIVRWLSPGHKVLIISNVPIKSDTGLEMDRYIYLSNDSMLPTSIVDIVTEYWRTHTAKSITDAEERIKVIIDEAQMLFNSRTWKANYDNRWTWFFSIHRHYGITVFLCTQYIKALDKQVQDMIEYEMLHRKISNYGLIGAILGVIFRRRLFQTLTIWTPLKKVVDSQFWILKTKYTSIYDTHAIFEQGQISSIIRIDDAEERREEILMIEEMESEDADNEES